MNNLPAGKKAGALPRPQWLEFLELSAALSIHRPPGSVGKVAVAHAERKRPVSVAKICWRIVRFLIE
jgi:hypothetical protein